MNTYTFKNYIEEFYNKNKNIQDLENILEIKLQNILEYKTRSSKCLYKLLDIHSKKNAHKLFQSIYLDYYRYKLTNIILK